MKDDNESSLDLLRSILSLMSQHAAGYHPISYALWYEYAKESHPALQRCVNDELRKRERLTAAQTYSMYARFLAEPAEQVLIAARSNLMGLVEEVKSAVSEAERDTDGFDVQLSRFQEELAKAASIEALGAHVSAMKEGATRASAGFQKLSTRLERSEDEVARLNHEIEKLRGEALIDAMSSLLNRRGFEREIERIERDLRTHGGERTVSLIMLDIDCFKRVNDTYGHPLGDRVIAEVGRAIADCTGDLGVAARYGGEEFAVLLHSHPCDIAEQLAEKIRERVEHGKIQRRAGETPIDSITISAGVAQLQDKEGMHGLIERADEALYVSKREGRNRVTVDRALATA